MSYDLRLSFTGLCLFVPSPLEETMYVLLPNVQGFPNMPDHVCKLVVDRAYSTGQPFLARALDCVSISDDVTFDAPDTTPDLQVTPEIFELDMLFPQGHAMDHAPDAVKAADLRARFRLRSGAITDYALGYTFTVGNAGRHIMSYRAEWTIRDMPGSSLTVTSTAGGQTKQVCTLHPIGGCITAGIYHVPPSELPPAPVPSVGMSHFQGYEKIVRGPLPAPTDGTPSPFSGCSEATALAQVSEGVTVMGTPMTCMLGQATFS